MNKKNMIILFSIQIVVFILCTGFLLLTLLFWDAPDMYATLALKICGYLLLAFPVLAIVGGILAKKNQEFFLLPLVSIVPVVILIILFFTGAVSMTVVDHDRAISEDQIQYKNILDNTLKDFSCSDGTFFSFSTNPEQKNLLFYFPSIDAFSNPEMKSYEQPPWSTGFAKVGEPKSDFIVMTSDGLAYRSLEGEQAVLEKLKQCKNKDGKLFQDLYVFKKIKTENE